VAVHQADIGLVPTYNVNDLADGTGDFDGKILLPQRYRQGIEKHLVVIGDYHADQPNHRPRPQ
jgi:hypothetical protein